MKAFVAILIAAAMLTRKVMKAKRPMKPKKPMKRANKIKTYMQWLRVAQKAAWSTGVFVAPADPWSSPEDPFPLMKRTPLLRWNCLHVDSACPICYGDPANHWPCSELHDFAAAPEIALGIDVLASLPIEEAPKALPKAPLKAAVTAGSPNSKFERQRMAEHDEWRRQELQEMEMEKSCDASCAKLEDPEQSPFGPESQSPRPLALALGSQPLGCQPSALPPSVPMRSTLADAVVRVESVMARTVVPPIVSVPMAVRVEPVARAADGTLKQGQGGHHPDPLGRRIKAWPQPPPFPPPSALLHF